MRSINFTEEYIDRVFYVWYENDRKQGTTFRELLPEDAEGRKPSSITINDWIANHGWVERADALRAEETRALDNKMIDKRIRMYEEQVEVADELLRLGRDYLQKNEFGGLKTGAEALRAIDLGLATKRISVGASEAYEKISKMGDEEIVKELRKLLGTPKKDEDSIIDAQAEEIK